MPTENEELTCLSMHQPWASLVVYGLKRIEGRTWDCQHRGRLWIHATAKTVEPADVAELQAFYTQVHSLDGGRVPAFPPAYPTGVLLGCVEVVDVLPAAAVQQWPGLPESCRLEAGSPFCFLCQNPKRLVVPQPLRGQQRLWQLPRAVLKVALQGLRDPPGLPPFSWRDFGDPRAAMAAAAAATRGAPRQQQQQQGSGRRGAAAAAAGGEENGGPGGDGSGGGRSRVGGGGALGERQQQAGGGSGRPEGDGWGEEAGGGGDGPDDVMRRLRAVRKKLRHVSELEALQQQQQSGGATALSADQVAKLARAEEWRREAAQLESQLTQPQPQGS